MFDTDLRQNVSPLARSLQIIVGAMIAGCAAFLVCVVVLHKTGAMSARQLGEMPLITYLSVALTVSCLASSVVVGNLLTQSQLRSIASGTFRRRPVAGLSAESMERLGDTGPLCHVLQTRTVIVAAMAEGAALFACVAYMLEGKTLALVCALAALLALVARFPTLDRVVQWLTIQREAIAAARPTS